LFSSRRRHTMSTRDWSSDVCSSDLRLTTGTYLLDTIPHIHHDEQIGKEDIETSQPKLFLLFALCCRRVPSVVSFLSCCKTFGSRSEERRVGKDGIAFVSCD